ncbi:MAG TPA: hypothetical protein VGO93_08120 [Candidatus Xenobia bacterium]|jgi:hypothetical protein
MNVKTLWWTAAGVLLIGIGVLALTWSSQARREAALRARAQSVAEVLSQQAKVALQRETAVAVAPESANKGAVVSVADPVTERNAPRIASLACPAREEAGSRVVRSGADPPQHGTLAPGFYSADGDQPLNPLDLPPDVRLSLVKTEASRGPLRVVLKTGESIYLGGPGAAQPAATLDMSTADGQDARLTVLSDGSVQVIP